jgi:hypothetical protein
MASLVLCWIDEPSASLTGIIDAMTQLWRRLLSSP